MDDIWKSYINGIKPIDRKNITIPEAKKVKFDPKEIVLDHTLTNDFSRFEVSIMNVRDFKNARFKHKLDLHGDTLAIAQRRVTTFLQDLQRAGERYAIIITGKGKGSAMGQGVLNASIPELFQALSHLVIGYSEARIEDGGRGAFYVSIRKCRSR